MKTRKTVALGVGTALIGSLCLTGLVYAAAPGGDSDPSRVSQQPVPTPGSDAAVAEADKANIARQEAERDANSHSVARDPQHSLADEPWYAEGRAVEKATQPQRGVRLTKEAPASLEDIVPTSQWEGTLNGIQVSIYAGANGQDASAGRLFVLLFDPTDGKSAARYLDVKGTGALTVTGDQGSYLTITDASGTARQLDLSTLAFK